MQENIQQTEMPNETPNTEDIQQTDNPDQTLNDESLKDTPLSYRNKPFIIFFSIILVLSLGSIFAIIYLVFEMNRFNQDTTTRIIKNLDNIASQMESIEKSSLEIMSLRQTVENQTAIFYSALGKISPLIVPEIFKSKFAALKTECDISKHIDTLETVQSLESRYRNYLSSTPPWIQEEQQEDLLVIRFYIQYHKVKYLYENEEISPEETERILSIMIEERPSVLPEDSFNKVNKLLSNVHDDLTKTEELNRQKKINALLEEYNNLLINKNTAKLESFEALTEKIESFGENEPKFEEILNSLRKITDEKEKQALIDQLNEQYIRLKDTFNTELWDNQKAVELLSYFKDLNESSPQVQKNYNELNQFIRIQDRIEAINGIKSRYANINKLSDETAIMLIPMLKTELSNLILGIESGNFSDVSEKIMAEQLMTNLNNSYNEYEKKIFEEHKSTFSKYNQWALQKIAECRRNFKIDQDNKSMFGGKEKYRSNLVAIFDDLLLIDENILAAPIRNVYQELYAEIMSDLEVNEKFEIAQNALYVKKKTPEQLLAE